MNTRKNLSISTCFDYSITIEKQIPLIAKAGFTHISLGRNRSHFDYLSKEARQKLKELLNRYSLKMDTIHGPVADRTGIEKYAEVAEAAAGLKARVVVFHGGPPDFDKDELNSRFLQLKKKCRDMETISQNTGAIFALENTRPGPMAELVGMVLNEFSSKYVGFCYDSAHDQIDGPCSFELLQELKNKLVTVHLSDRVREFVDHVIPWEGFIDWDKLCGILKSAKITFPLLFEVMTTNSAEKDPEKFLALAYERGCRLYDKIFK